MSSVSADRVALAVSIASAVFAGAAAVTACFQAWDAHQLLRRQFATSVSFAINTQAGRHRLGIGIENAGPGVARIKSVSYYVDGKLTNEIADDLEKLGMDPSRDEGFTLGPGGVKWIIDYRGKTREDEQRIANLIADHVQVAVEYCDANEEYETQCSGDKGCPKP
jgi:predicted naringenin-chalcone synthase